MLFAERRAGGAPHHDRGEPIVVLDPRQQLAHQARLADAGLADQPHDMGIARHRPLQAIEHSAELGVAADQRRAEAERLEPAGLARRFESADPLALKKLESDDPQRRFDAAVALEKAGSWREAEEVLRTIESYEPRRENRAVSSVAYYRARAAVHLRAPIDVVRSLLDRAEEEAHGDPFVLALRSLLGDVSANARLNELYDPFTRDYALATAYSDTGHIAEARAIVKSLRQRFPEWNRPAALLGD